MKIKNLLPVFIILLLAGCVKKEIEVIHLSCEQLNNPEAIENKTPSLSWLLHSSARGKSQTAYRILVASNPELLKKEKADQWDSGIIQSDQSLYIPYEGTPLKSRQTSYWKVKVWDEKGNESDWSEIAYWSMGLLESTDWSAKWIKHQKDEYPDSVLTYPAPYFRKEMLLPKPIKEAKVYICGLGFYELYINDSKVGNHVLAPAVTNYDKRIIQKILYHYDDQSSQRVLYNTFDITSLLNKGSNAIGVILGNGWYNQRDRTVEGCMWYDTPRLILQLEITYTDGSIETIETDTSWKCTTGPLLHDAIFTGEKYDARLELEGWSQTGYDDSNWEFALETRPPTGKLHSQLAPHEYITGILKPTFEGKKNDSTYLFSLPEIISGWTQLKVQGNSGDEIKIRFISEENRDYGQSDIYILKGDGPEVWEPRFTWHTFRYMEIISKNIDLNENNLLVKVVHTVPEKAGRFTCSNDLFNKINESYIRTQNANFHGSVSMDCPHRERLAYTGDGQVIVESSIYSFDMSQFYQKWFNDMQDAQNKNSGYVPHSAPFGGGGGGPAWGSAYVIMPWTYYCYYGEKNVLEEHYEGMKHWVEYLGTRTDERGIVVREEPNGWCLGDWCTPEKVEIPESLVNTAYYYHCADLMAKVAGILEKEKDRNNFRQLAEQIKENFHIVFYNPSQQNYWEGRQGANVFPLAFGMVPESLKQNVFNSLLTHLAEGNYHFDTGILATPLLLKVLTENGKADIAYKLMDQRSQPGYAYLLDNQYTGLWESWYGRESLCHPMFGSVVAWFYNSLAGIRFDEAQPGMKHIIISPTFIEDLSYCKASYQSIYGIVHSEWEIKDDTYSLIVEIPANTTATINLPVGSIKNITESNKSIKELQGIYYEEKENNLSSIYISSGVYYFKW